MAETPSPLKKAVSRAFLPAALFAAVLIGAGIVHLRSSRSSNPSGSQDGAPAAQAAGGSVPQGKIWFRAVVRGSTAAGVIILLAGAAVLFFENRLVFRPSRQPLVDWHPPDPAIEEVKLRTRDGVQLDAWWHPGSGGGDEERPVLLFCHGNAGNITHRVDFMCALADMGLSVFLFDYRGYGRSEGSPSERGLYFDADTAYRHLVTDRRIAPQRIVCLGRSLGAAVALQAALHRPVAGVVMESPFESIAAMARTMLLVRPFTFLVKNQFDCLSGVRRLGVPLLVAHGENDALVPIHHGKAVFAAAREPKQFYLLGGAGHNDTLSAGGQAYMQALRDFCVRCVRGGAK